MRCCILLCLFALSASSVYPQTPAAQTSTQQASIPTIQAHTRLVFLDVVVADAHQNPVHNLKATDFTVLEKNVSQPLKSFEEHSAPAASASKPDHLPPMPPGTFTNFSPLPPTSSLTVILLDTLNTPMKDQAFVRDQLKQFLKNAQPGARIAIFGLTTRLNLLQGFTSDPELLKTIISQKNPYASPLLDDAVGGGGGPEPLSETLSSMGTTPNSADVIANLQQFEAQQQSFQLDLRVRYTLDAMNQLARYLSGIPGRKNLIWFSGSFPIGIFPDSDLADPFASVATYDREVRETTSLLTLSRVAVYPVDARGLMGSPNMSAANSGAKYARNPTAFGKDEQKFFEQIAAEHTTMLQMAEQTGGKAFINTNGLAQAAAKAIENGSNYYTLTYSPTNTHWNGGFRKIQVRLQQQGYNLSYRSGYFADDLSTPGGIAEPTGAPAPTNAIHNAMMRGGPTPSQILFKVRVLPTDNTPEENLADGNLANPNHKTSGPYSRYAVDYAADPRALVFTQDADGTRHLDVEFLIYVYDQDGNLINIVDSKPHATLNAAAYATLFQHGVQFHQQVSVPVKGRYYLRIGIHDLTGDRVGAVEFPVAAIKNLPPLQSAATPSK